MLDSLREIAGAQGDEMIARLYRIFRDHAPGAMQALKDAVGGDSMSEIANAAHALKSMSKNMACTRLAGFLDQIEDAARADAEPAAASAIAELTQTAEREFEEALTQLDRMFGSPRDEELTKSA